MFLLHLQKFRAKWFLSIVCLTLLTLTAVYFTPQESPLIFVRYVLGFIFVSFVPGHCLFRLLFSGKDRDMIEEFVLSLALSYSIVGITGLFLGLSPIKLTFESTTLSLTLIVLALSFLVALE